jgi:hypothetical protein
MATAKPLEYKGYPVTRKDNILYYGNPSDNYIVKLQILETKKVDDIDVASKVSVQLQLTNQNLKTSERIVKRSEKNGLYEAMDIANIWLTRALTSN